METLSHASFGQALGCLQGHGKVAIQAQRVVANNEIETLDVVIECTLSL